MLRGAILLSLIGSVAASTVCSILDPVLNNLPESLGCSCEAADSGVGGTATCAQSTPEVNLYLATVPAVTITLGTELLPCETPAKASVHISISLPEMITESESTMAVIQTTVEELSDQAGITAVIDGGAVTVEQAVEAEKKEAIDLPIYQLSSSYMVAVRILVTISGNMQGLALKSEVDVCLVVGEDEYCGADLFDCVDQEGFSSEQGWCLASGQTNVKGLFGNPPYPILSMDAMSFEGVCPNTDTTSSDTASSDAASSDAASSDTASSDTASSDAASSDAASSDAASSDAASSDAATTSSDALTTAAGATAEASSTSSGLDAGGVVGLIILFLIIDKVVLVGILWKLKMLPEKLQSKLDANIKLPSKIANKLPSKGPRVVDCAVKEESKGKVMPAA